MIPVRRVPPEEVRRFNTRLMGRADRFVFAHEKHDGIKRRFDRTPTPRERVQVSSFGPHIITEWNR